MELQHESIGEPLNMFSEECDFLYQMRSYDHAHMIKTVAACMKGDFCGFILPRCTDSLQGFWQTVSRDDADLGEWTEWMLVQFHGVTTALELLYAGEDSDNRYAHPNLTPSSILCFPPTKAGHDVEHEGKFNPATLVIGDANLKGLELRKANRGARSRYAAPYKNAEGTRRHDMWAVGCIIVEFIIWLLYGETELSEFQTMTPDGFFRPNLSVLPEHADRTVQRYIEKVAEHEACRKGTCLGELLRLVVYNLLRLGEPIPSSSYVIPDERISIDKIAKTYSEHHAVDFISSLLNS
jgi:hypothetical protein